MQKIGKREIFKKLSLRYAKTGLKEKLSNFLAIENIFKRSHFFSATFLGEAFLLEQRFSGKAYFSSATFKGEAEFIGATFSDRADFWGIQNLKEKLSLLEQIFSRADFWHAKSGKAFFKSLSLRQHFQEKLIFSGNIFRKAFLICNIFRRS